MNNTEATAWIDKARPMIEFIEAKGGPKMPNHICISTYGIISEGPYGHEHTFSLTSPPAVAASVCMWANDCVFIWFANTFEYSGEVVFDSIKPDYVIGGYSRGTLKTLTAICEILGFKADESLAGEIKDG